jgi:hypothetical protein
MASSSRCRKYNLAVPFTLNKVFIHLQFLADWENFLLPAKHIFISCERTIQELWRNRHQPVDSPCDGLRRSPFKLMKEEKPEIKVQSAS